MAFAIGSRQLSWAVASLSKHTSDAVPILHSFQTALIHAYGLSSKRVEYFKSQKAELKQEWEHWVALLEQCFTYSRNLLRYSHTLTSTTPPPNIGAAESLLQDADVLRTSASQVSENYNRFYDRFEHLWIGTFSTGNASQPHPPGQEITPRLVALTLPSVHTPLSQSLLILQMAIGDLKQIYDFWREHCRTLRNLRSEPLFLHPLPAEMTVWCMYHDTIRQGITNITASCDAISVIRTKPLAWNLARAIWNRFRRQAAMLVVLKGSNISQYSAIAPEASQTTQEGFKVLTSNNHFNILRLMSASRKARKVLERLQATKSDVATGEVGDHKTNLVIELADHCCSFYESATRLVGEESMEVVVQLIQKMSEDAATVVRLHQQVMEEHSTRLTQWRKPEDSGTEEEQLRVTACHSKAKILLVGSRLRPPVETALEHLYQSLESFDNFWFSMLAATAFLQTQPNIHIRDATNTSKVWKKQEESYRKYSENVKKNDGL
ncbi:hypothetical protein EYR40_002793 [Pleurotus pulmonarius]|nr:hypothetical protein EYR40_002793 [Pleurotus pulmonarius]KAF4582356.1 hypothetical protein EYR38_002474 [Pleurotus pulmonarius]